MDNSVYCYPNGTTSLSPAEVICYPTIPISCGNSHSADGNTPLLYEFTVTEYQHVTLDFCNAANGLDIFEISLDRKGGNISYTISEGSRYPCPGQDLQSGAAPKLYIAVALKPGVYVAKMMNVNGEVWGTRSSFSPNQTYLTMQCQNSSLTCDSTSLPITITDAYNQSFPLHLPSRALVDFSFCANTAATPTFGVISSVWGVFPMAAYGQCATTGATTERYYALEGGDYEFQLTGGGGFETDLITFTVICNALNCPQDTVDPGCSCPAGTTGFPTYDAVNDSWTSNCLSCPNGTTSVADLLGGGNCKECDEGSYALEASPKCYPCPSYTYQDQKGQASCRDCPVGRISSGDMTTCVKPPNSICSPGTISLNGSVPCVACPPGRANGIP